MKKVLMIAVLVMSLAGSALATTADGQFVVLTNNGATFTVKVQLKVDVAAGFGGGTIKLSFNNAALSFPNSPVAGTDYTFAAFNGGSYDAATITHPLANQIWINTAYNGSVGAGTPINTTFTDVVTINFTTITESGASQLTWVDEQLIADDQLTSWTNGTFTNLNTTPLPIQLATFQPTSVSSKSVTLSWATLSETNNYGFEVQRSAAKTTGFATIPGSFTKGNGTTTARHTYSYTDAAPTTSQPYYRLHQIDLNNADHYSDVLDVTGVATAPVIPTEFAMRQNYPNPFNPTTIVEFDLPKDSHVTLELYNILGQRVMEILNEVRLAGTQQVQVDASRLASGVYLYRLAAGDKVFMKKMTLIK